MPSLWLLKTEPDTHVLSGVDVSYSIDRLEAEKRGAWFGIRNLQARNFIRDKIRDCDRCLFYHSSCKMPAVVGICRVVGAPYPDKDALKPGHPYFDAAHTEASPRWYQFDVEFERRLAAPVTLASVKADASLSDMTLVRQPRLSIQPVTEAQWARILELEAEAAAAGAAGGGAAAAPASSSAGGGKGKAKKKAAGSAAADDDATAVDASGGAPATSRGGAGRKRRAAAAAEPVEASTEAGAADAAGGAASAAKATAAAAVAADADLLEAAAGGGATSGSSKKRSTAAAPKPPAEAAAGGTSWRPKRGK